MDAFYCFELRGSEDFIMEPGRGPGCYRRLHIGHIEEADVKPFFSR